MYLTCFVLFSSLGGIIADFPGLRRPPLKWNASPNEQQFEDEKSAMLAQIGSLIEHQARLRLLQQLAQINREKVSSNEAPFYRPDDPRYYLADYNNPVEPTEVNELYSKLKAPMEVNPKTTKLPDAAADHGVVQKPVKMDDSIGVYMVAMIAGISAAFTVAAIAIGLAWYTLRQRIKAAADVEYPAYGVTGPSKDLLYPENKKFAQSVDMYHYQQQKSKKLSMEKQSNGETNDGFSDLDGEYETEDGDYTVYECPGLASTGEMEVKNPLFADEPITVAHKHQPASKEEKKDGDEGEKTTTNISPKKKSRKSK